MKALDNKQEFLKLIKIILYNPKILNKVYL